MNGVLFYDDHHKKVRKYREQRHQAVRTEN